MTIRMNAALRRRLAASVLGGLVVFAAVPAMAQWLPPWRTVVSTGDIAARLEAQGYLLVAPLQRRPGVYLADVRAGPGGFQRLVIDDRSGEILERFISPPRSFGSEYAVRYSEFGEPPPPGVVRLPSDPGIAVAPNGGQPARSADDGPTNLRIPSAVSPFGSQLAPLSAKPKPKSPATARKIAPPSSAPPLVTPLPPPAPREAAKPDESAPTAPKPEPRTDTPPGERQNASAASGPAAPEVKPEAAKTQTQAEAQAQPAPAMQSSEPAAVAPTSTPEASDKPKVSIVPPALFE
jgi:hypothetical protein